MLHVPCLHSSWCSWEGPRALPTMASISSPHLLSSSNTSQPPTLPVEATVPVSHHINRGKNGELIYLAPDCASEASEPPHSGSRRACGYLSIQRGSPSCSRSHSRECVEGVTTYRSQPPFQCIETPMGSTVGGRAGDLGRSPEYLCL